LERRLDESPASRLDSAFGRRSRPESELFEAKINNPSHLAFLFAPAPARLGANAMP
jgi:hypothetical protein